MVLFSKTFSRPWDTYKFLKFYALVVSLGPNAWFYSMEDYQGLDTDTYYSKPPNHIDILDQS